MTAHYAVLGQPIAQSLSPRIHAAFAAEFGMSLDYRAIECARGDLASALVRFVAAGGRGANVTLPLKREACSLCIELGSSAQRSGSVNTLSLTSHGWRGDSTDGAGLLRDLRERQGLDPSARRILLLGAGGAARAIAPTLLNAGAECLLIANRSPQRAIELAGQLGDQRVRAVGLGDIRAETPSDLIIDATSAGHDANELVLPAGCVTPASTFYTLSYGTAARHALDAAMTAGAARVADGLGMLIEQAAESFALWHDRRPETASMYARLRAEFPLPD